MVENVLCHVVLIKVRPEAPKEMVQETYRRYQRLLRDCGGEEAGILHFDLKENLDTRKGVTWVEVAYFRDHNALHSFRIHPAHAQVTDLLRQIADWQVGDYVTPPPKFN